MSVSQNRFSRRSVTRGLLLFCCALVACMALLGSAGAATIPGQYIVVLKGGVSEQSAEADAAKNGASVFQRYHSALNGYAARMSDAQVAKVKADARVLFVSPDRELTATASPAECTDLTQCQRVSLGVDRIDADLSSTRSGDGSGSVNINVAVLDSGIQPEHPDLNVVGGTNCSNGKTSDFSDVAGHGTLVAGFIGAEDNGFGRVGVAPGARLWSVRVLDDQNRGTTSSELCGVDWVTATRTDADPTNDIAVANMSLGGELNKPHADDGNCGRTNKDPEHLAICSSVVSGVTYVASAGNQSVDFQASGPATFDEVLTATAMADTDGQPGSFGGPLPGGCGLPKDFDDMAASFSNFATLPSDQAHTVAAPGVCIGSTYLNSTYAIASGTSFSSPLVAGTVALCIASGPCAGLTAAQIVQKMVADAAAYNTSKKGAGYGFSGDPLRAITGKYYGYLIRAGLY